MHLLARTLALLGPLVLALPAPAQEFPSRPITLICPWPPGGSTDTHLRRFAEIAAKYLGQPIPICGASPRSRPARSARRS